MKGGITVDRKKSMSKVEREGYTNQLCSWGAYAPDHAPRTTRLQGHQIPYKISYKYDNCTPDCTADSRDTSFSIKKFVYFYFHTPPPPLCVTCNEPILFIFSLRLKNTAEPWTTHKKTVQNWRNSLRFCTVWFAKKERKQDCVIISKERARDAAAYNWLYKCRTDLIFAIKI